MATITAELPIEEIDRFCKKWRITELAVFGSARREDFGPSSDIDLLYVFEDEAP